MYRTGSKKAHRAVRFYIPKAEIILALGGHLTNKDRNKPYTTTCCDPCLICVVTPYAAAHMEVPVFHIHMLM